MKKPIVSRIVYCPINRCGTQECLDAKQFQPSGFTGECFRIISRPMKPTTTLGRCVGVRQR